MVNTLCCLAILTGDLTLWLTGRTLLIRIQLPLKHGDCVASQVMYVPWSTLCVACWPYFYLGRLLIREEKDATNEHRKGVARIIDPSTPCECSIVCVPSDVCAMVNTYDYLKVA